ncbi:MAG: hypothetical protein Q7U05_12585 [Polaromonas sp.]|nr:hypothetical protein [Polaromonas sp.]
MTDQTPAPKQKRSPRNAASSEVRSARGLDARQANAALCWPFPPGSQNDTDKAVKLKPYVPLKHRTLNQY